MFPESNGTKFWSYCFHSQNSSVLQTRMDQKRNSMKTNFENFQMKIWILQTIGTQKVDAKTGVICLVSFFPSWVMVLKFPKIVSFLQFFVDVSKDSKVVIAIYVYVSESSCSVLLENGTGYYAMILSLEDISISGWWTLC